MGRVTVITIKQVDELEDLKRSGAVSANDFNRHVLESLVERGYATKHHLGSAVTYTISAAGLRVLETL